jgi:hypothetical protein
MRGGAANAEMADTASKAVIAKGSRAMRKNETRPFAVNGVPMALLRTFRRLLEARRGNS